MEHALALPVVLLTAFTIEGGVSEADLVFTAAFAAYYMVLATGLRLCTGKWVYPIFTDVAAAGGVVGVAVFMVVLTGFLMLLSWVGIWLAN